MKYKQTFFYGKVGATYFVSVFANGQTGKQTESIQFVNSQSELTQMMHKAMMDERFATKFVYKCFSNKNDLINYRNELSK